MGYDILNKLKGGDLRSEGKADEAARQIVENESLLKDLVVGLSSDDKILRGRVCMTMEIISRTNPKLVEKYIDDLIKLGSIDKVPQVRWHIAEIISNIYLSQENKKQLIPILLKYLDDKSKIVKYCAIQALGFVGELKKDIIIEKISQYKDVSKSMGKIIKITTELLDK
ncbi:MAG: HEAT repeat domain-containing protein [Actinomycetia bacterium]|nr:HEAT repeat domain-containing protein [Actinomycetes bacterium]